MQDSKGITPEVRNRGLADAYYSTCYASSKLRVKITTRAKVSKAAFRDFKAAFDYLFQITWTRRELKEFNELSTTVKNWLSEKHISPSSAYIEHGLSLFDKYQIAMIESNLISDGV